MRSYGILFRSNIKIWLWVNECSEVILMQNVIGVNEYTVYKEEKNDILVKFCWKTELRSE